MSVLSEKKAQKRTVTSRRAQWGTRVPEGIGLGNLRANYSTMLISIDSLPPRRTHEEGGRVFLQLVTYSDQLITDK